MSTEEIMQRAARREISTSKAADMLLEERVQVATVTHRARVAMAFGAFAGGLLYVAFWATKTPRRWLSLLFGAACAVTLYALFR